MEPRVYGSSGLSIPLYGFWRELVKVHPQLFKLSIPLYGFSRWRRLWQARKRRLSIPLYGFPAPLIASLRLVRLMSILSIPLYGFVCYTLNYWAGLRFLFQFHCMDSRWLKGLRKRVSLPYFQFHCMDSTFNIFGLFLLQSSNSFNSIVWIHDYIVACDRPAVTVRYFQFHCMDSRHRYGKPGRLQQRKPFQFHCMDSWAHAMPYLPQ